MHVSGFCTSTLSFVMAVKGQISSALSIAYLLHRLMQVRGLCTHCSTPIGALSRVGTPLSIPLVSRVRITFAIEILDLSIFQ